MGAFAVLFMTGDIPQLTTTQRQDIINWLNAAATTNQPFNNYSNDYHRNDGAAITYGVAGRGFCNPWLIAAPSNPMAPTLLIGLTIDGLTSSRHYRSNGHRLAEGNEYGEAPTALHSSKTVDYGGPLLPVGKSLPKPSLFQRPPVIRHICRLSGTAGGRAPPMVGWAWDICNR